MPSQAVACRDKSIIVWSLTREEGTYGFPRRALRGHSHFVQDVVISSDGQFALSGSWDATLRLWELNTGTTSRRFLGHTKDVLSVAFSVDNRQVHAPIHADPLVMFLGGVNQDTCNPCKATARCFGGDLRLRLLWRMGLEIRRGVGNQNKFV